jgi:hypothetical protein
MARSFVEIEPRTHRAWYLANRAEANKLLAVVRASHGGNGDFVQHFRASVADCLSLVGDAPAPERRHLLALTYDSWASAHLRHEQPVLALARAQDGLKILDVLVRDHPGRASYATSWLLLAHKVAAAMVDLGRPKAAADELRGAVARGREFLANHPDHVPLHRRLTVVRALFEEITTP